MKTNKGALGLALVIVFWGQMFTPLPSFVSAFTGTNLDYTGYPPFLSKGDTPNALIIIDNSASMYDLAYIPAEAASQGFCYDDKFNKTFIEATSTWVDTPNKTYAGYFELDLDANQKYTIPRWYSYDLTNTKFIQLADKTAMTDACDAAAGTRYNSTDNEVCVKINAGTTVTFFGANSNFMNWAAASKFDIEKKVLTGGKYDSTNQWLVMESRGCMDKTFIKQTTLTNDFKLILGIKKESNVSNLTTIEILKIDTTGFVVTACKEAVEAFVSGDDAKLGEVKDKTKECMEATGTTMSASGTAVNHVLQECWYFNKKGNYQPGGGTVSSMESDCEKVYGEPGVSYVDPITLKDTDICYGNYQGADDTSKGFVGQCWKLTSAGGAVPTSNCNSASGGDTPTGTRANPGAAVFCNSVAPDLNKWLKCDGSYNKGLNKCTADNHPATSGLWEITQVTPSTPGDTADWIGTSAVYDACVDAAIKKYCSILEDPGVPDPSDAMSSDGTTYNVPAYLMDFALTAQKGDPLLIMKGLVNKTTTPTGLLDKHSSDIRFGTMAFNTGTYSECAPVQSYAGAPYVANLNGCLESVTPITAGTLADASKKDGASILTIIGKDSSHLNDLKTRFNDLTATAWTPTAEAYFNAIGYYTQRADLRINSTDFLINSEDAASYPLWVPNHLYTPTSLVPVIVRDSTDKLYQTFSTGTSSALQKDGVTAATGPKNDGSAALFWTPIDPVQSYCQSNNVLILTDGASTADQKYSSPASVVTTAIENGEQPQEEVDALPTADPPPNYTCGYLKGSTLFDDLTYFGQHRDIFSSANFTNWAGGAEKGKNINAFIVSTGTLRSVQVAGLAAECDSNTLLTNAAANGLTDEDGNPGVLYNAEDPNDLETKLDIIFTKIGAGLSSATAASVISNSRSGEGAIYQAVFFPNQPDSHNNKVAWIGDLHSLWLDDYGNMREDTNHNQAMDLKLDKIVEFYTGADNTTRVKRYIDADGDGKYSIADLDPDGDNIDLRNLDYLWSAGMLLAGTDYTTQRTYNDTVNERYIFTSIDGSTEVEFTETPLRTALVDDAHYLAYLNASTVSEATDIVNFIRGKGDISGFRLRQIDWDEDGDAETYKLGDIVHSTPTVVAAPSEDYDVIYNDDSYRSFRQRYNYRRTMIYAGGNDGGLHAFNGGYFDRSVKEFLNGPPDTTQYTLGSEMWMFIPKNLLPHLKWLTSTTYTHVYYADLKPEIFDAKIFAEEAACIKADGTPDVLNPNCIHPKGWGTVLVGGMRFGGGEFTVATGETMRPSYYILDITNPEEPPNVLAEFTDPNLGYTTVQPTAIPMLSCDRKIANNCPKTSWPMDWYLAFGSGPIGPSTSTGVRNAMLGISTQDARLYILRLGGTGALPATLPNVSAASPPALQAIYNLTAADAALFPKSFFSDVISVDYNLDYRADTLYFGSIANTDKALVPKNYWGGMHRLKISDDINPANWGSPVSKINTFYNAGQPVTAAPSAAYDGARAWVYFGTGRLFDSTGDKTDTTQQSYYGLKERYDASGNLDLSSANGGNLVDVSNVWVENITGYLWNIDTNGVATLTTTGGDTLISTTLKALNTEISQKVAGVDKYHGWKINFPLAGERNLGQAAILGDIVTFTTYLPSIDICASEGESFLWATYYRTGTSYLSSVIGLGYKYTGKDAVTNADKDINETIRRRSLGRGMAITPNIHVGGEIGSKAFVQTSTGSIISIQETNPGVTKSGVASWRDISSDE